MNYNNIFKGIFKSRPNRFIANVEINGKVEVCHVKNTGRCKELLVENATVYLEKSSNLNRKTAFDLVAVEKGDRLINMDSYAPNIAAYEFLPTIFQGYEIKAEKTFQNSRIDFYLEKGEDKVFVEVKGVTLENQGVVMFPDAPSLRAVKHLYELKSAVEMGYRCFVLFVVQMENVLHFIPNSTTHKAFAEALKEVNEQGVDILCYDCVVTENSMNINKKVPVIL